MIYPSRKEGIHSQLAASDREIAILPEVARVLLDVSQRLPGERIMVCI